MFDSHCHPTDIDDPVAVIEAAVRAGVRSLLACGYNAESNAKLEALRGELPWLPIALGVHPWYSDESTDELPGQVLRAHAAAIGECGLDWSEQRPMPPRVVQRRAFEYQLDLAQQRALPVTVHSRQAIDAVREALEQFDSVRGVMHAFGGSFEQAKPFIERGWLIGIGGAVTRPEARRVRRLVTQLPLSSIALETDCPAIGMAGVRGPDVRPAHVRRVAEAIGELRGVSGELVIDTTSANVDALFGYPITRQLSAFDSS